MAQEKTGRQTGIWNWIDRIQGDKVIWMIVILLILYSIVTIFSSTSQLASKDVSRIDIFMEQMVVVGIGVGIIIFCYAFMRIGWIRWLSQLGFIVSAVLLVLLFFIGKEINGAKRVIEIAGFQLNVYEVVKVAMVVYLSWAIHAYRTGSFWIANILSAKIGWLSFLSGAGWQRLIYIHFPIVFVTVCILAGGFSSAMFIGGILILTVLIGGVPGKDIAKLIGVALLAVACSYGLFKATGGKEAGDRAMFSRWATVEERIVRFFCPDNVEEFKPGTKEWQEHMDEIRQPEGAKIAIKEGGLFGKGPGKSTQKYTVALIFSDFMFSFIIEEYGLLFGAIPLIILYVSLLARGSIIVRYCDNEFARTAVAGLTLLISTQAMMHMFINVGLWPLTGQTLPMISHGNSSFLAFSVAFGILLSISKMAKKKVDKAVQEAEPLIVPSDDDVKDGLDDLDAFESN